MPAHEKGSVLRRLLPFWEVHRFRIGPQVHAALERDREGGGLTIERGGLAGIAIEGNQFAVSLNRPGEKHDRETVEAVVLCSGPDKNLCNNPLVASLLADGTAKLDQAGLGIAVDGSSHILGPDGRPCSTLLAFGPITRGSFGEMTGAPDITSHVEKIVKELVQRWPPGYRPAE